MTNHPFMFHLLCGLLLVGSARAETINDPTRPFTGRISSAATQKKTPQLQGIYRFGDTRVAIVDGVLVREGDQLQQAIIVSIGDDHVRYARKGSGNTSLLRMTPQAAPATATHSNAPMEEQP